MPTWYEQQWSSASQPRRRVLYLYQAARTGTIKYGSTGHSVTNDTSCGARGVQGLLSIIQVVKHIHNGIDLVLLPL